MPENPYEPPKEEQEPDRGGYAYPYRVIEWVVIIFIVLVAIGLLLPVVRF